LIGNNNIIIYRT